MDIKKQPPFLSLVLQRFIEVATQQEEKGITKYGHELKPMDQKWDWLVMAEEELVDGYKYIQAEKARREYKTKELHFRVTQLINFVNILEDEIITLIDGYDHVSYKDIERVNKMFDDTRNKLNTITTI